MKVQVRKASRLIHPDKCKLENAGTAFALINEGKKKFKKIINLWDRAQKFWDIFNYKFV